MKKNMWILGIMLLVVAVVSLVAMFLPETTLNADELADTSELIVSQEEQTEAEATEVTAEPEATAEVTAEPEATAEVTAEPEATNAVMATAEASEEPQYVEFEATDEVEAYVLITAGGVSYEAIPLTDEGQFTLRQDGTDYENTVYVTTHSIRMEHANCDNQDCIGQGEVTLENKDERLLGNFIVCLPNQITLELLTAEEWEQKLVLNVE